MTRMTDGPRDWTLSQREEPEWKTINALKNAYDMELLK